MLKKILLISILLLPILALSQGKGYRIDFQIKGWENKPVYFKCHYGRKILTLDSVLLNNEGKSYFKGDTVLPGGIYILELPKKFSIDFIVDEHNHFFSLTTDTVDIFNHLKFKGSDDNEAFLAYQKHAHDDLTRIRWYQKRLRTNRNNIDSTNKIDAKIGAFNNAQNKYRETLIKQHEHTFFAKVITALMEQTVPKPPEGLSEQDARQWEYEYYKAHYWDNLDFSDDRFLRTTLIENKMNSFFMRVVPDNVDSIIKEINRLVEKSKANPKVYRFVLDKLLSNFGMRGKWRNEKIYVFLANKYYFSGKAPWVNPLSLKQLAFKVNMITPTMIGKRIPTTVFTTMDNSRQFIVDTIPAKILILYFWSSDCPHCKKYTPKLYDLYKQYKDKGLEIVAVTATNNDFDGWRKYVKENQYNEWINCYYKGNYVQILNLYNIFITPRIFILDQNKTIIYKDLNIEYLGKLLKQRLSQNH